MKVGISSYTFTWAIGVPGKEPEKPMNIFQLIDKASDFDVSVLQVADNLPLNQFTVKELSDIKQYADKKRIQIEVGARMMTPENLKTYISLAEFFNSPILRFVIDGNDFEPDLKEIHKIIFDAVPLLEKKNIVLALENHDRFLSKEFVSMINKSKSKHVRICLDSVNSMGAGEGLETVIGALAPLTVNLHVKEFKVERVSHKMGFIIEGCPLGEGMLPLQQIIEAVPQNCTSAILEQWTPPEATIDETIRKELLWAEKSIAVMKRIIPQS